MHHGIGDICMVAAVKPDARKRKCRARPDGQSEQVHVKAARALHVERADGEVIDRQGHSGASFNGFVWDRELFQIQGGPDRD